MDVKQTMKGMNRCLWIGPPTIRSAQKKINITVVTDLQTSLSPMILHVLKTREFMYFIILRFEVKGYISQPHRFPLNFFSFAIHQPSI